MLDKVSNLEGGGEFLFCLLFAEICYKLHKKSLLWENFGSIGRMVHFLVLISQKVGGRRVYCLSRIFLEGGNKDQGSKFSWP